MEPYIGEIRMFGGDYAPRDWALCDGHLLKISEHEALFSLLGARYGGDGTTTFAVPDLRGRVPVHHSDDDPIGRRGGKETVTLQPDEFPEHSHPVHVSDDPAGTNSPEGAILAEAQAEIYRERDPDGSLNADSIGPSISPDGQPIGENPAPHPNMQPYQCVNFIIALSGIYPERQ